MLKHLFVGFLVSAACGFFVSAPAMAQNAEAKASETVEKEEGVKEESPEQKAKQDALTDKIGNIMEQLDLNQIQHFTVIYANYMMYSLVNSVERDVSNAVTSCGENNADLKDSMGDRFKVWQEALMKPKEDAMNNINNMIIAQNYLPKAEFDSIFALIDEARLINSSEFEKIPATTPEACKYMLGKMDETQKNMVQLLGSTLVTYPDMLKKTQK